MSYHIGLGSSIIKQAAVAVTGYTNPTNNGVIDAGTALFVTNSVGRGDVLLLGLVAEVCTITNIGAGSTITTGDYFDINSANDLNLYRVWFNKDDAGGPPPVGGRILIEIAVTGVAAAGTVRTSISTTLGVTQEFNRANLGGTGVTITNRNGGVTTNIVDGTTGWTFATTVAGTDGDTNSGSYIVADVISETKVEIFGALPTLPAPGANVQVRRNDSVLFIQDESAGTLGAASTAYPNVIQSRQLTEPTPIAAGLNFILRELFVLNIFGIPNTATDLVLQSNDEMVLGGLNHAVTNISGLLNTAGTFKGDFKLISGTAGSDLLSVTDPSIFVGVIVNFVVEKETMDIRGSVFAYGRTSVFVSGKAPVIQSCYFIGGSINLVPQNLSGGFFDTLVIYSGATGAGMVGLPDETDNITTIEAASGGFTINGSPILSGMRFAADVFRPLYQTLSGTTIIRNPKEPYTTVELFGSDFTSPGVGLIWGGITRYTFNPRFVTRDEAGNNAIPLSGLDVKIEEIDDEQGINIAVGAAGTTYTVTINGTAFPYTQSGTNNLNNIRNGLKTAINAGAEPVTARTITTLVVPPDSLPHHLDIIPDDPDVLFTTAVIDDDTGTRMTLLLKEREESGSPYTSDSNGRINTDGVDLEVGVSYKLAQFHRQHRVTISGPDTRQVIQIIRVASKQDFDFAMDLLAPDLEGELSQ